MPGNWRYDCLDLSIENRTINSSGIYSYDTELSVHNKHEIALIRCFTANDKCYYFLPKCLNDIEASNSLGNIQVIGWGIYFY